MVSGGGVGYAVIMAERKMPDIDFASRVLAETDTLLVVDKPAGLETVVTGGGNTRFCLRSILRRRLSLPQLEPAHRLDRDTTGCVLFAKTSDCAEALQDLFRGRKARKEYLAVCLSVPRPPSGTIRHALSRWTGGKQPVRVLRGKGLDAQTDYRTLASAGVRSLPQGGASLVLFRPLTGRTHQIRVHAAAIGCPILGDDQYGDRAANRQARQAFGLDRQALHAWTIEFKDPRSGKILHVRAPVPKDMQAAIDLWLPRARAAIAR